MTFVLGSVRNWYVIEVFGNAKIDLLDELAKR